MQYQISFGQLGRASPPAAAGQKFRLAVLGDFSGRANAGKLQTGAKLASRKPIKVDVDNLDDVLARFGLVLTLPLAEDDTAVSLPLSSLDDFHPDQLVEKLEFFESLLGIRRNLSSKAGFDRAAKQVLAWGGEEPLPPPPRRARGATIATDHKLSDFARLTGRIETKAEETVVDDLLRRLVGPFVQPARDARQDQIIARVDEALSAAMRRVLHHPDFQTAEAVWRGVDLLVRRIETGAKTEIVLYDISAEELAADLAAGDALEESGLYGLLVEQPALDAHQGPLSAVIGLYNFDLVPPHADLLGRIAQIAAAGRLPFIAGIAPDPLKTPWHEQHPLIQEAFGALQALPQAAFLGLAAPRFLLRLPYGRKTDPVDAFAFEEFTRQGGLGTMLWGHPALLPGLLLAQTWQKQGAKLQLGEVNVAGDMPYFVYTDIDDEQIALPCTERLYSERQAVQVASYKVMPLLSLRGRPEVRLGGFTSLAGSPLAGFWGAPAIGAASAPSVPRSAAATDPVPQPAPEVAPEPVAAAETVAETEAGAGEGDAPLPEADLDALLAGLAADAPPAAVAEPTPAPEPADLDLDALLASLNAEPPPVAPDTTEPDLDALLASLK